MNVCYGVCLFACTADSLYILLTGIKVFRGSGAKMRKEEGSNVNKKVARVLLWWFTMVPFHILPHLRVFFFSWQDCLGYFILVGAGKKCQQLPSSQYFTRWWKWHAAWLLSVIDGPTHQQAGHSTLPIKGFHKHFLALMDSHWKTWDTSAGVLARWQKGIRKLLPLGDV